MFRRVRFECAACGAGFVDWHDEGWQRSPVFCVECGSAIAAGTVVADPVPVMLPPAREVASALGVVKGTGEGYPDTLRGIRVAPAERLAEAQSAEGASARPESRAANEASSPESGPLDAPSSAGFLESEAGFKVAQRFDEPRFARATSSSPKTAPIAPTASDARSPGQGRGWLPPIGSFLLGFAVGVPLTFAAQSLWPSAAEVQSQRAAALDAQLEIVAASIESEHFERARRELAQSRLPNADWRVAMLRARLSEAQSSAKSSALAAPLPPANPVPVPVASASPAPPPPRKSPPSWQAWLATARDSQRRLRLEEAEQLYERVLNARPGESEARAGLAEVQLLRGSVRNAQELFARALRGNENYVPAWVALADIDWLGGHSARAACRYQLVVDRFPEHSYPPYIVQRIASVLGSGVAPPRVDPGAAVPDACDR